MSFKAALGAAGQVGGPLIQGLSGFSAGKANARALQVEADSELRAGVARADDVRRAARRTAGEAIAAMAAGGGQIGTGSPLDVLTEIALESGLDRMRLIREGENRADSLRQDAARARRQGANALLEGWLGVGSQLLGPKTGGKGGAG